MSPPRGKDEVDRRSLCALRPLNVSASTFSHGRELTTKTHVRHLEKTGATATYLYRGDPSSAPLQRCSAQAICRAHRGFPRLLVADFEASWPPSGPSARKGAGVCRWSVVPLVVPLETLVESLAERERGPRVENEHQMTPVQRRV
jgi:hypothetical protein